MPGEGDGCIHHLCADFLFKFGQNSNGNLTTGIKHSQTDQLHFFLLPYRSNLSSKTNLYGACFFQGVFLTPLECIVQPSVQSRTLTDIIVGVYIYIQRERQIERDIFDISVIQFEMLQSFLIWRNRSYTQLQQLLLQSINAMLFQQAKNTLNCLL